MRILVVGGGSGGHVTPVVAVVAELQQQLEQPEIQFWCDRPYYKQARALMAAHDDTIPVRAIASGKLRRYQTIPLWRQLLMLRLVVIPNIIDSVRILRGLVQSLKMLRQWRPKVVFTKGGFVCLPVGLAARMLRIPLVIHDSDAHPGLTNRILARWATAIATGAPVRHYPYPKAITHYVGIPLKTGLKPVTADDQQAAKSSLGFDTTKPLVVVTGGGLGALRMNDATASVLPQLLKRTSVMLVSGTKQYDELAEQLKEHNDASRFQLRSLISKNFLTTLAAADIVVTRAGATTLLELATLGKPTIVVPNARLTGGHQTKNAAVYHQADAIELIDDEALEDNPELLRVAIEQLLDNPDRRAALAKAIHQFAKPRAAQEMAALIVSAGKK